MRIVQILLAMVVAIIHEIHEEMQGLIQLVSLHISKRG